MIIKKLLIFTAVIIGIDFTIDGGDCNDSINANVEEKNYLQNALSNAVKNRYQNLHMPEDDNDDDDWDNDSLDKSVLKDIIGQFVIRDHTADVTKDCVLVAF